VAQHFDVSLKLLFRRSSGLVARAIFGGPVEEWLNVELPKIENPRVDLLARGTDGTLRHLELESHNNGKMGRRVAEYYLAFHRRLDKHVEMVVLYIGKEPLRMEGVFKTPSMDYGFRMLDIRDFEGEPLIESGDLGDNMLALLTECDQERVLRRVEEQLQLLPGAEKLDEARLFVVLSGLRDLEATVSRRLQMIDLMENKVLGPAILRGEAAVVAYQLKKRFGPVPESISSKLDTASEEQLMDWAEKVLTAKTLDAVFSK
jgi:hypothetical protein